MASYFNVSTVCLLVVLVFVVPSAFADEFSQAKDNAALVNEGFNRCQRYVDAWLKRADPVTGLIPRHPNDPLWNPQDSAADNYPFMVLTTSFTNSDQFYGVMRDMLETEQRVTNRVGCLPDAWDLKTQSFRDKQPRLNAIMFGASEYVKDGLLPLTEWLGVTPWSARMMEIIDEMWSRAAVQTPYGDIVSDNVEVNGEMLQVLSRVYWMSGRDEKYLDWAIRLGDYYLLGEHHPTRDLDNLRLRDHGCEIVSGLCELYAMCNFAKPGKKKEYQKPIHEMLDRILEVGRNEHGLFYNAVNPKTGEITRKGVADTWGYTFNGYYTVYLIDRIERYRDAMMKVFPNLAAHYRNYAWEGKSADGYADSIECGINLYNREPMECTASWIDSEMRVMWSMQQESGLINGVYPDGNFARTTIMYCLWKTQGVSVQPWRKDVKVGSVESDDGSLCVYVAAEKDYSGRVIFDVERHRTVMKMPMDWPRINQFPEWFTVEAKAGYILSKAGVDKKTACSGVELHRGLPVTLKAGEELKLTVRKK